MSVSGVEGSGAGGGVPVGGTDPAAQAKGPTGAESESSQRVPGVPVTGMTTEEWHDYLMTMAQAICQDTQKKSDQSIAAQKKLRQEEEGRAQS